MAIFRATCLAAKLQDKFHRGVTLCNDFKKVGKIIVAIVARIRPKFYGCNGCGNNNNFNTNCYLNLLYCNFF